MKIAFFSDTYYPQINGVTNTFNYLSKYLKQNGIEHIFFAPDYDTEQPDSEETPVYRFKGITPLIYPECRLAFPQYSKVAEILSAFNPDVVHIATELGIGYCGLRAARALHLPVVMSYHTNYDKYLEHYALTYLSKPIWSYIRWFHSFASVNLCPSRNTLRELTQRGFRELDIWTRGIDTKAFCPRYYSDSVREELGGRHKTVFLYVGRIAREKGLDTMAESIMRVNETCRDTVRFVFTGDGPYLKELLLMNIENTVFTGPKRGKALSEIYASCDVFVFPSGTETFGNVMLEAMASGLPGICVDEGGVTDFTAHGENACVCRYRDAASLSDAMIKMTDPDYRRKIRGSALMTAQQRDWNTIFDDLLAVYAGVTGKLLRNNRRIAG